uniref:Zgc:153039 n=1 Tax=Cyprinodon variegatus TaxID=28743 RepID=A0A3Q2G1A9_CYPVA
MTERTPLLNYPLLASVNESEARAPAPSQTPEHLPDSPRRRPPSQRQQQPKKLSVFFGVVVPTLLSMFSVVLFLRIGFVVGHAGLYQSILMFLVAYFIISMTVLSVCAISTNGALDAGGAYCILLTRRHVSGFGVCLLYPDRVLALSCSLFHFGSVELKLVYLAPMWSIVESSAVILVPCLVCGYTEDYTTGKMMTFATVFAVMFNGCTGIMAGSNMSGDLKNPSYAIPRGTITAVIFTFIIYNLLSLLVACSCERVLLQRDYSFLRDINIWNPFVITGVYCSTLSAAMSNLIGASRILYALAKDDLFGTVLSLAKKTSHSGNPWVSVLMSWFLVQVSRKAVSLSGVFLVSIFGPTFRYFTWYTCVLGIIGCAIMMFLINAIYASASIAFMLLLLLLIHYLSPTSSWGYISQALIFHQVRKYLLMLDVRKDHIKFWRPQVLLMVSNPRSSVGLITFINDIKKSGLYVLGHVQLGDLSSLPSDPLQAQYDSWLSLVDHLNIKAFVNLTLADSVRHGVQHLLFISGLGGMRPNTLVLGFYDDGLPKDKLIESSLFPTESSDPVVSSQVLGPQEFVSIISDAMKMLKNVVLARYFNDFDRAQVLSPPSSAAKVFVDVWPVNLLRPDSCSYVDTCSLFLLQLACILNMVKAWRKATLRLFLCVEEGRSVRGSEAKLGQLLKDLRIKAQVYPVPWDQVVALHWQRQGGFSKNQRSQAADSGAAEEESEDDYVNSFPSNATRVSDDYLTAVNRLILDQAIPPPAVRFLYLPRPPADTRRYAAYLHQLDLLTQDLGPALLIHGVTPVITTDL